MISHGFRSTTGTILNERDFDPEIIELQLAHQEKGVRRIYNRAVKWDARVKMMQRWSDMMEDFRILYHLLHEVSSVA